MLKADERQKRIQAQQTDRHEDLQKGRIRIERLERETSSTEEQKKATK
jgi:hypothetical protein